MKHHIIKSLAAIARGAMLRPACLEGLHPRREMQLMVKVCNRPARKVVVVK